MLSDERISGLDIKVKAFATSNAHQVASLMTTWLAENRSAQVLDIKYAAKSDEYSALVIFQAREPGLAVGFDVKAQE